MAITYVASSDPVIEDVNGNTSTYTVDVPAGVQEGDMLVLVAFQDNSIVANHADWTFLVEEANAHIAYWHLAGASEPASYTFDMTTNSTYGARMVAYRSNTGATIHAAADTFWWVNEPAEGNASSTTSFDLPAVTAPANSLLIAFGDVWNQATTVSVGGMTDRWSYERPNLGELIYLADLWSADGSEGPFTVTYSPSSTSAQGFMTYLYEEALIPCQVWVL